MEFTSCRAPSNDRSGFRNEKNDNHSAANLVMFER